jgi:hypothetical protein
VVFIFCISPSCKASYEGIVKKVARIPIVQEVTSLEIEPVDFGSKININIILTNGGYIALEQLNSRLRGDYILLSAIDTYQFHSAYFDFKTGVKHKGTLIRVKNLEKDIGHSLRSLKNILNNYEQILDWVKCNSPEIQ